MTRREQSRHAIDVPVGPRDPLTAEVIEEYRVIMENAASVGSRRQTTNDVFVSLNALFLTGIGILLFSSDLSSWKVAIAIGAITAVVLPINVSWLVATARYSKLQVIHYQCMQGMERRFEFIADLNAHLDVARSPTAVEIGLSAYLLSLYVVIAGAVAVLSYLVAFHYISPLK